MTFERRPSSERGHGYTILSSRLNDALNVLGAANTDDQNWNAKSGENRERQIVSKPGPLCGSKRGRKKERKKKENLPFSPYYYVRTMFLVITPSTCRYEKKGVEVLSSALAPSSHKAALLFLLLTVNSLTPCSSRSPASVDTSSGLPFLAKIAFSSSIPAW